MKIYITTSSVNNPYAYALAFKLIKSSQKPAGFILIEPSKLKILKFYYKYYGWFNTLLRIFKHPINQDHNQFLDDYVRELGGTNNSIKDLSEKYNLEIFKVSHLNQSKLIEYIKTKEIDVVINAGGGLFRGQFINAVKIGVLNAHMGLLPQFRGMNALEWSLFYRYKLGVTIHFISKGLDTGDILSFKELKPTPADTIETLRYKSVIINVEELVKVIASIDKITPLKQLAKAGKA